ncbi:hypothetical protein BRAO375_1530019 [Bradyrhizobium sp. ORS 375]|nr:hypothetical protein BRAO375_1530019 [Bradyrhizobium sp. ORS 375]
MQGSEKQFLTYAVQNRCAQELVDFSARALDVSPA